MDPVVKDIPKSNQLCSLLAHGSLKNSGLEDLLGDGDANTDEKNFSRDKSSSQVALAQLGLVHRDCRCLKSSSHTCDDATNDQMRNTVCSSLKNGADDDDGRSKPDDLPATKTMSNEEVY
jgi:hypothetical protein